MIAQALQDFEVLKRRYGVRRMQVDSLSHEVSLLQQQVGRYERTLTEHKTLIGYKQVEIDQTRLVLRDTRRRLTKSRILNYLLGGGALYLGYRALH